ncbi:MAG TPA: glutaminyl-peptide cyclotransferase, partial [Anaerolineales bacterium]
KLNELECVGDSIYANVWMTNNILRINKHTGKVTGVIDASGLLTPEERAQTGSDGVLNGIAYDPDRDVFLVTGKLWPKLFEVKFVPKIDN